MDATEAQRRFILDEMQYWDGNRVRGRCQLEYSSKEYENALVIQTLAHTCGMMSTIMPRNKQWFAGGETRHGIVYKVSVLLKKDHVSSQQMRYLPSHYRGYVYCVTVPSGMILVRQEGHITVTGNCDALSLYEAGARNVVSVPSGCTNLEWIDHCWDWLEKFQAIVLFGDNDEPGRKMVREVVRRLDEARCSVVEEYPDRPDGTPCKDANEI